MSAWNDPGDRDRGRKRRVATIAGGTAVVAAALGVTACAATSTGNSGQASLSGPPRQIAAVPRD
jgi:hypothetical protein